MSDDDQPYDNDAAQKIDRLTREAVNGREEAVSHVNNHDVIEALRAAARSLNDTSKFHVCVDYDHDSTVSGTVIGFRVTTEPMISVRYTTTHGHSKEALPHVSGDKLVDSVDLVKSPAFEAAAIEEIETATEAERAAADRIE